jgi:hypothetical protein
MNKMKIKTKGEREARIERPLRSVGIGKCIEL